MKTYAAISLFLLITACATSPKLAQHDVAPMHDENDKICENHKSDFEYFSTAFNKEHADVCSGAGCVYTPSMNKNSDTMERIAGVYYLMSCDANHGRL